MFNEFKFHPLKEDSIIKPFKCKVDDLNGFIKDDAKKYLSELMAVTYLLDDHISNRTIAYFSLLNDKIVFNPENRSGWNRLNRNITNAKRRRTYPSVKIGRFAISQEYEGRGIGQYLIDSLKYMFTHGNRTGCRFLTVDAYRDAVGFYQKCGFSFISEDDRNDDTRLMYYDLKSFLSDNI